ncbi:hypothetical protein R1sor_023172 [Riccia sorocarpa]|uniref:Uncharacterized protein n=1 Tax=Riccia sorocarpa TaxID=122646 RepID=A0ABD3GQV4_9MARC
MGFYRSYICIFDRYIFVGPHATKDLFCNHGTLTTEDVDQLLARKIDPSLPPIAIDVIRDLVGVDPIEEYALDVTLVHSRPRGVAPWTSMVGLSRKTVEHLHDIGLPLTTIGISGWIDPSQGLPMQALVYSMGNIMGHMAQWVRVRLSFRTILEEQSRTIQSLCDEIRRQHDEVVQQREATTYYQQHNAQAHLHL